MDATEYQATRLKLMELVYKAQGLPALSYETRDQLINLSNKLKHDQFKVVLVGNFQGGKSTTFNALCGGREISPRGSMTKTSASVLEAQYTDDPSKIDRAEIEWRSHEDLMRILQMAMPGHDRWTWQDWVNAYDRGVIAQQAKAEAADLTKGDMLRLACIILQHHNHPELQKIKSEPCVWIENLSNYVCFPKQWEKRWENITDYNITGFTLEECIFAFVKRIRCFIDAPFLKMTDMVIVDSPGLDASEYDAWVAKEVIREADSIWYLLGSKSISEPELDRIKDICKTCYKDKYTFFFTLNITTRMQALSSKVIPSIIARFGDRKVFDTPLCPEDIRPYHALLALNCLYLARLRKTDSLPKETAEKIVDLYHPGADEPLSDTLLDLAEEEMEVLGSRPRAEIHKMDLWESDEDRNTAFNDSGLSGVMTAIAHMIRERRATIILGNSVKTLLNVVAAVPLGNSPQASNLNNLTIDNAEQLSYRHDCEQFGQPPQSNMPEPIIEFLSRIDPTKLTSTNYMMAVLQCREWDSANRTVDGVCYANHNEATQARYEFQEFENIKQKLNDLRKKQKEDENSKGDETGQRFKLMEQEDVIYDKLRQWSPMSLSVRERKLEELTRYTERTEAFGIPWRTLKKRNEIFQRLFGSRCKGMWFLTFLTGGGLDLSLLRTNFKAWTILTVVKLSILYFIPFFRHHPLIFMTPFYLSIIIYTGLYCDNKEKGNTCRTWCLKHAQETKTIFWIEMQCWTGRVLWPIVAVLVWVAMIMYIFL